MLCLSVEESLLEFVEGVEEGFLFLLFKSQSVVFFLQDVHVH